MSIDGLIATLSVVGSVNTEVFLFYIQQILIPQLWVGAIIVMDNTRSPCFSGARGSEAVGAKVVFLPLFLTFHRLSCVGQNSTTAALSQGSNS